MPATAERLSVPGLKMRATGNIAGVQWGKLLVNLNNALNALSGLPLRQQLAQRVWRRLFADQMAEGLAAIRAEGIRPVSPTPIPSSWTPHLLRLPDAMFEMLLGRTMKIDPEARSSMWEDLQRGRRTEIDYLQGVIIEIADRHGLEVPLSRRIVALIKSAEAAGKGSPGLTPEQIRLVSRSAALKWRRSAGEFALSRVRAGSERDETILRDSRVRSVLMRRGAGCARPMPRRRP